MKNIIFLLIVMLTASQLFAQDKGGKIFFLSEKKVILKPNFNYEKGVIIKLEDENGDEINVKREMFISGSCIDIITYTPLIKDQTYYFYFWRNAKAKELSATFDTISNINEIPCIEKSILFRSNKRVKIKPKNKIDKSSIIKFENINGKEILTKRIRIEDESVDIISKKELSENQNYFFYISRNSITRLFAGTYKKSVCKNMEFKWITKNNIETTASNYTIEADICSSDFPEVTFDNEEQKSLTTTHRGENSYCSVTEMPQRKIYKYKWSCNVQLKQGVNTIKVKVANRKIRKTISSSELFIIRKKYKPVDKKIALVIANSDYKIYSFGNVSKTNIENDGKKMRDALKKAGFDVIFKTNLSKIDFKSVIKDFFNKMKTYDASFFYYSGHAIEISGKNYLVPVNAKSVTRENSASLCFNIEDYYAILNDKRNKCKSNIIVLDACRTEPDSEQKGLSAYNIKDIGKAKIKTNSKKEMLIAYATSKGKEASASGFKNNSLYTSYLLKNMDGYHGNAVILFQNVNNDMRKNKINQFPWTSFGSFTFEF